MDEVVNCVEKYMVKKNVEIKDKELFRFGLKKLLSNLFVIAIIAVISLFTKTVIPTMIFLCTLLFVRSKTGGYHFEKSVICFIFSIFIPIVVIAVYDNVSINQNVIATLCVITSVLTILLSPIDHPNKKLSNSEKNFFRKETASAFVVLYCLFFISEIFLSEYKICNYIKVGIIVNFLSMLFALIKNNVSIDEGGIKK